MGNHSLATRWKCNITPTPAGTNSSDRWDSNPDAAVCSDSGAAFASP